MKGRGRVGGREGEEEGRRTGGGGEKKDRKSRREKEKLYNKLGVRRRCSLRQG